ncbi:HNH endonuclease signature motif containing protein [Corynebacterium casei]|uniref:HNH endonuclease signature motif containing protein n=1 Tax=Corynebacterium casei TaxID=160386 RepID=UPI003FD40177
MNQILQAFRLFTSKGVEFLRLFDEHSPYDIASYGIELSLAKEYSKLADALFSSTNSTRLQRDSIALAEEKQLSVNHLLMIDKLARQLNARGAAWKLRAELIAYNGTLEEVKAYGQQRIKELIGEKPKEPGVRLSRSKNGMRTLSITDTQRSITDFEKTLAANITDEDKPRSAALLEAFWNHVNGNGGVIEPKYRPVIAIGLEESAEIFSGAGSETNVGVSDGTTMTGAEIVNLAMSGALGDKLYAGLFHPTAGPVNLYEARFASPKQRILATAENLVCPWPDCGVPADRCQVHHIDAHKNGGQTNPSNLTMLCKYHNGVNDDGDPGTPGAQKRKNKRRRMRRHRGKVRLQTPGGKLVGNTHELSTMGAMDLI